MHALVLHHKLLAHIKSKLSTNSAYQLMMEQNTNFKLEYIYIQFQIHSSTTMIKVPNFEPNTIMHVTTFNI